MARTAAEQGHSLLDLLSPGEKHDAGLDQALMDLFSKVGAAVQTTRHLLAKKSAASSALAKALLAEEEFRAQESLQAVLAELNRAETSLTLDTSDPAELRRLYTTLSFLDKWRRQINEKLLALITDLA